MVKNITRILLIVLLFLPLLAAAHFMVFPQETNCMLVEFSALKKHQNIYYRKEVPPDAVQRLIHLKSGAEQKVTAFWKQGTILNYKLIYAESASDYEKYGRPGAPAVAILKMGACVVIPKEMFDENILAHEISHTVLYRQIGWLKFNFEIPTWFSEGLAMQVDDRDYYSIDTLLNKVSNGVILPDVTKMDSPAKFHKGSSAMVMLNYSTARYVVHEWLKKNSLDYFVRSINKGYSFEESYNKK